MLVAIQLLWKYGNRNIYNGAIKGLYISDISGVWYTDLRGLPSGILFGRVWTLIKYRTTKNSTRCPATSNSGPLSPDYVPYASTREPQHAWSSDATPCTPPSQSSPFHAGCCTPFLHILAFSTHTFDINNACTYCIISVLWCHCQRDINVRPHTLC